MGSWLATHADRMAWDHVKRFDPAYWTVNFPRPMMASSVTTAPDGLRVDAIFYRKSDLAGLIWESEDRWDHPLLAYETARDYRGCALSFRWRSGGILPLDAINGPTLTIEGRDAEGNPRDWYVRLWNYATGDPEDAVVRLDFSDLDGGFLLPGEADPVWAGDVERMFISLVAPGHAPGDDGPLAAPVAGWAELSEIGCEGGGSSLRIGDALVPEHGLRIATGYDDGYNVAPARMLRNIVQLGYRGTINHYVGMSHYFRLGWDGGAGAYLVPDDGGDPLNAPCRAWHEDFLSCAGALGLSVILSLSYELLDQHCPAAWKQRAFDGAPALTGWDPPSALLSPANADAMGWLQAVARGFAGMVAIAGQAVRFQVGEPWWWIMADGRPCLYDAAAVAAYGGAPVEITSVRVPLAAPETALLDAAGALLASSTADLCAAVRAEAPEAELLLLAYLPGSFDPAAPEVKRANMPQGWAKPAFDVLQLEDYEWVTAGRAGLSARAIAEAEVWLGYPADEQHYFSGFVLDAENRSEWIAIEKAVARARARGVAETFAWALPQAIRDGWVHFDMGEEEAGVEAFDEVDFPLALGARAEVEAGFSTAIVTSAAGHEQRNADWADARMRYDAGPGVRSEADIAALLGFFRARRGAARGFRLRDPLDCQSGALGAGPTPADQIIGTGDGIETRFRLVKHYGDLARPITRPVAGSVLISLDGVPIASGWSLLDGGWIEFDAAPAEGVLVRAGYLFDVPVRFAEDRLRVGRATFLAGEAPSVPLVEIRED